MRRSLQVAALSVTFASCSQVKLAYTWLDWVLERQASQYLDLTREQSDAAEKAIDGYLAWHRAIMLPRYARFLRQASDALRLGPVTRPQFDANDMQLRAMYEQTISGAVDVMAALIAEQSSEQISHLEAALSERHQELTDDMEGPGAMDERVESFTDGFEDLLGDLRDDQKAELERRVRALYRDPEPYLRERARRNGVLVQRLRSGAGHDEIVGMLRIWWLGRSDPSTPPAYEAFRQAFATKMKDLLFATLSSLDAEQRTDFADRLDDYAEDFEDLATTS